MTYPADCSGTEFQTAVDKNIEALRSETRPFALVHDCRVVRYSTLDMRLPFLDWGRSVLGFGIIERVAFVVGEGAWLATLNGMLRLSPVQPARIFSAAPGDNLDEAERWSREEGCSSSGGWWQSPSSTPPPSVHPRQCRV